MTNKWISVSDKLPEVGKAGVYRSDDVLVVDNGDILTACFVKIKSGQLWWRMSHIDDRLTNVTHWMPLPEPPTQED